jgi:lysophospholipase L1-like esterase
VRSLLILARAGTVTLLVGLGASVPTAAAYRYAALGDSYAAGVGTGVSLDSCGRSPLAYPQLAVDRWAGGRLQFLACGGATTAAVRSQAAQIAPDSDFVSVTVGGNDVGFNGVVGTCTGPNAASCSAANALAQEFIRSTMPARVDAMLAEIGQRAAHARVFLVGYPHLVGKAVCSATGRLTTAGAQQLNVTTDLLRDTLDARVAAAGPRFAFVDVTARFAGHEICSGAPWLGADFHPTATGQREGYLAAISAVIG